MKDNFLHTFLSAILKGRGEEFLVLQIFSGGASGALIGLDAERRLTLKKVWRAAPIGEIGGRLRFNAKKTNVVIAADVSRAYTAIVPLRASRPGREPVGSVELENLLAQAVGKVFNQCRGAAAKELGSDELHVMIARSRVLDFKIDGHRVVNPLGFTGEKIEAVLELTLTTREVVDGIQSFLKSPRPFFFTDVERSELMALERIARPPFGMVTMKDNQLSCIAAGNRHDPVLSRGIIPWQARGFRNAIQKSFGAPDGAAAQIYARYLSGEMSPRFKAYVKRILDPVAAEFFEHLRKLRIEGRIYLNSAAPVPFPVPVRRGGIRLEPIPLSAILGHFGLTIERPRWPMPDAEILEFIAPVIESYYDTSNPTINHWLRRHLNWLGTSL